MESKSNGKNRNNGDLLKLSSLAHYLRGFSATLGLTKVRDGCAKIEYLGQKKQESGDNIELDEKGCLATVNTILKEVVVNNTEVGIVLKKFYGDEIVYASE
jgi:osomolarity two-component system phosphorelay intermediate protein YPD1